MLKKVLAFVGVLVFGVGMFFIGFFVRNFTNPDLVTLKFVLEKYKNYYLEQDDNYIDIMVEGLLDGYSEYYTKEEYDLIKKAAKGVRVGVGITVAKSNGLAYIVDVKGNSPAEIAGVKKGGYIIGIKKASESEFQTLTFENYSSKLEEQETGERFNIKVDYAGEEEIFELAKREYNETYVFYTDSSGSYRFTDGGGDSLEFVKCNSDLGVDIPSDTAYLKYKSFNGSTNDIYGSAKQVEKVMEKFASTGKKKIIIDLRGNGGGFMDIMCSFSSHFIGASKNDRVLVSYATYKDGKKDEFRSNKVKYTNYGFTSIIILADSGTASASEAFIGACLDYDYRNIVKVVLSRNSKGEYKTYGKGIMQTTFVNTSVGDALKLTTAKIYWPVSNISIHGVGITENLSGFSDKIYQAPYVENIDYELNYALSLN